MTPKSGQDIYMERCSMVGYTPIETTNMDNIFNLLYQNFYRELINNTSNIESSHKGGTMRNTFLHVKRVENIRL